MWSIVSDLAGGIVTTVEITVVSFFVGALLGAPLVILRRAPSPLLHAPAIAFIEIVRAIPPIVWLFIVYYGVGSGAVKFSTVEAAVIGLGMISGAYLAEIYRSGLQAIDAGQWLAVDALALPRLAAFRHVILPQAILVIIPPAATYAIGLLKDTAIASVIGANDITFLANERTQQHLDGLGNFGIAALLYILLSIPIAAVARGTGRVLTQRLQGT